MKETSTSLLADAHSHAVNSNFFLQGWDRMNIPTSHNLITDSSPHEYKLSPFLTVISFS